MNYSLICWLTFLLFITPTRPNSGHDLRDQIDYPNVFSPSSEVTALFLSCAEASSLKIALQSFLMLNTYPLKKIIIGHCLPIIENSALPLDF